MTGCYSIQEAAHLLQLPASTVRVWVRGQRYATRGGARASQPVIRIDDPRKRSLSFRNLVELHVLASIRRRHRISLPKVRTAVRYLERKFEDEHPLASSRMLTDGKDLLVQEVGKLVNASHHGQLEIEAIVGRFLDRVEHDADGLPVRLYPVTTRETEPDTRLIVLDPHVQFGRACLTQGRVPTAEIAERFNAGESTESLADDFRTTREAIEAALRFEARRAA
jgi:uncharacterized protein (DUF433 family)